MITGASTPGTDWFLNGLNNVRNQEALTTKQISSGYRISTAADDPSSIVDLVGLTTSLARNQVAQSNYASVQTEVQSADQTLTSAISIVDSARTLGLQAGTGTATASSQQAIAQQVQGLLDQIVSLGNTAVNGRYIFSGDTQNVQPFQMDSSTPLGYSYKGAATSTRQVLDQSGTSLYTAPTAQQLFDHRDSTGNPAPDNVVNGLYNLLQAIQTNPSGIGDAVASLQSASSYLNQQQSAIAAAENNLTAAQSQADTQKVDLQTRISSLRDTDVAQAAVNLNMEKVAESAALAAQGGMSHKSLFDYLG